MVGVNLIIALSENIGQDLVPYMHDMNKMFIDQLSKAETTDYKNMIIQGLMMFFWLNQQATI